MGSANSGLGPAMRAIATYREILRADPKDFSQI